MARQRNYQAEYARRIERGAARGLSRSQARGHPRPGETYVSARKTTRTYDPTLEEGLQAMRSGTSLTSAARSIHVSPDRLGQYLTGWGVIEKRGPRWQVGDDRRPREIGFYSAGRDVTIVVSGFETASLVGHYQTAVKAFLSSNNRAFLDWFVGKSVVDVTGKRYRFETRTNALYRLASTRGEPYEQIYRIVV